VSAFFVFALLVGAIMQSRANRRVACSLFILPTLFHELLLKHLDGLAYYLSAASLDVLIIVLLSKIARVDALILRLQIVCTLSITINAVGFVIWFFYYPPTFYNLASCLVFALALIVMSLNDVGKNTLDRGRFSVCRVTNTRSLQH